MRSRRFILIGIIAALLLSAGSLAWLLQDARASELRQQAADERTAAAAAEIISDSARQVRTAAGRGLRNCLAAEHVFSHRGASLKETEHTFAAYDQAIREGSHYIEQDIVISSEGTLYVSHDPTAWRLTGDPRAFESMTDEQIDSLRTADGQKILRLSDVFDRYGKRVNYVIELKDENGAEIESFRELVDGSGLAGNIIVQSFSADVLQRLAEFFPDMPRLYLCRTQADFNGGLGLSWVDILSVREDLMSEGNCAAAHERGKQFNVWVLDSKAQIRTAIGLGVDTYFTDETARAISLEKKYRPEIAAISAPSRDASKDPAQSGRDGTPRRDGSSGQDRTSAPLATFFLASDYQQQDGFPAPAQTLADLLTAAAGDQKDPDMVILCGDYTNDRILHNYQLSPEGSIAEIRSIVKDRYPAFTDDQMLFLQGNHDRLTGSITASGLHEYDDYLIYVLNTENDFPWSQGKTAGCLKKVKEASKEMRTCFDRLIRRGERRPILITAHVPLHFTARVSSRHSTGDNLYASLMFDVINEAARSLDIVYFYGHNHSKGWDCYMGGSSVYKAPGETLLIPAFAKTDVNTDRFTEETLRFTYLNAGYTGYFMNCDPKTADADTIAGSAAADETLTATVCEICPGEIRLTRYDTDGRHPLGADGEGDPYKDHIDRDLIDASFYSHRVDSPQSVPRR